MSPDRPAILFVSNPQTSKNNSLPQTDLFENRMFGVVVNEFDQALGLSVAGSLHPARQIASVVMSVASHRAFAEGLNNTIQPGLIDPKNSLYRPVFTGHSIGEMASLIEAGVCNISTMAWMLNEREKITQRPLESALRQMVAFVGVNADQLEANLHNISSRFQGEIEFYMANHNTPRQAVLAFRILQGEVGNALENVGKFVSEIADPTDSSKKLFPKIRLHSLLPNGFHTVMMIAEEAIYMSTISPILTEANFKLPNKKTIYSPTLPGWINTQEDVFSVVSHILTKPVRFSEAMEEIKGISDLACIVTADVVGTLPRMISENGIEVPVLNIKDQESLTNAINRAGELIR